MWDLFLVSHLYVWSLQKLLSFEDLQNGRLTAVCPLGIRFFGMASDNGCFSRVVVVLGRRGFGEGKDNGLYIMMIHMSLCNISIFL